MSQQLMKGHIRTGRFPHEIMMPGPITLSLLGGTLDHQMTSDTRNGAYKGLIQTGFALHAWNEESKVPDAIHRDGEFCPIENTDEDEEDFIPELFFATLGKKDVADAAFILLNDELLYSDHPVCETAPWKKKSELPDEITDDLCKIAEHYVRYGIDELVFLFQKELQEKDILFCVQIVDFITRLTENMSQKYNNGHGVFHDISQKARKIITNNASKKTGIIWRILGQAIFDDKWVSAVYH